MEPSVARRETQGCSFQNVSVVTEYAFQITRPSVIDDVAEILEEAEVERRHHNINAAYIKICMVEEPKLIYLSVQTNFSIKRNSS